MPNWIAFRDSLESIRTEWDKSEEVIKAAEQVNHKVNFPSIKELRYGGRRLIEALHLIDRGDDDEAATRLQDAEFCCYRARHDAMDAATSKIAKDLALAAGELGSEAILSGYGDFPELLKIVNRIRKNIRESRRDREKRDEIYSNMYEDFKLAIDMYSAFQESESVIIAFAEKERRDREQDRQDRIKSRRVAKISVIIAAISAAGLIAMAIKTWYP